MMDLTFVGIAGDDATPILNTPRTTKKARMIFCGKAAIVGRDSACRINVLLKGWCRNEGWWLYKSLVFLKDAVEIPAATNQNLFWQREREKFDGVGNTYFLYYNCKEEKAGWYAGPDETPQACPLRWSLALCLRRWQQKKYSGFKKASGAGLGPVALQELQ